MISPSVLRSLIFLAGAAALLVDETNRAAFLRPAEAALSLILLAAVYLRRGRRDLPLLISVAALFCGDLLYFINGNLRVFPGILFPAEEAAYTVYILAMAWYLLRARRQGTVLSTVETVILASLLAGFSYISAKYVLLPFFASGNFATPYFYVTSTVYRATEALVVALAVLLGMKARSRYWLLTLNGLVLLAVSSLALGYNTGVLNEARLSFPFQEYGWLWGLLCLVAAQTYPVGEETFARWQSARVRLAWLIFVFNAGLLSLLYMMRALVASDAFHLSSLLLAALGLWIVANLIAFRISENIHLLLDSFRNGTVPPAGRSLGLDIYEVELFAERLRAAYEKIRSQSEISALAAVSAQVAHDIRSPLAALDSAMRGLSDLPEQKRLLIRGATGRIRDIANDLLEKNRPRRSDAAAGAPLLISGLIEPVITEKRLQYRDRDGLSIEFDMDRDAYGLFAAVDQTEFGRVLSNLVNNSVEAMPRGGSVTATLSRAGGSAVLTVRDTGKGIPPEILERLGRRGETHGKENGSGLGIYHARESAKAWGGGLTISSRPGEGTAVSLSFPLAPPPAWFAASIQVVPGTRMIVLDDDASIHRIWKGRFDSSRLGECEMELLNFSSPETLRRWFSGDKGLRPSLFLFDYELSGREETGLDVSVELGVTAKTVLVTSRCEEPGVVEACVRRGIRLVPKNLAGLVPISVISAAPAAGTAVLLDNDELARLTWKAAARAAGIDLRTFSDRASLMSAASTLPVDTPLYIDFELGAALSGTQIAADLRNRGFTDITLVTGHSRERFSGLTWLKISGKEPPWLG